MTCLSFNPCEYCTHKNCNLCELEMFRKNQINIVKEIFAKMDAEIEAALESNYKARSVFDIHDEFYQWVQGKIDALRGIQGFVEELKKKYTGGTNEKFTKNSKSNFFRKR